MKSIKIKIPSVLLLLMLLCVSVSYGEDSPVLTVYYFHRPPYYEKLSDGTAGGFLVEITRMVLDDAGIDHEFEEIPPKRILMKLRKENDACSVGWFRTAEREEEYRFSESIYQDKENVFILCRKHMQCNDPSDIAQILSSGYKLTLVDGFSYGEWYDRAIDEYSGRVERISSIPLNIIKMINACRTDYTMLGKEEALFILESSPELAENTEMIYIKDAPQGNHRYLLFPKQTDPELIKRVNESISRIKNEDAYRSLIKPYE